MSKVPLFGWTAVLCLLAPPVWGQANPCDLTKDGKVDVADVQAAINMSLGLSPCTAAIAGPNVCNVIVVQRVANALLGGACLTSTGLHVVSLTWAASTSSGVTGYQVSRGTQKGGPYTLLASVASTATNYTDTTVQSGLTYFYVVSTVSGDLISPYSSEVQAVIAIP